MQEKVNGVAIGLTKKKCHFLSVSLADPLTREEISEFCQKFFTMGIALDKEFVGKEIFIYPGIMLEDYFLAIQAAAKQYQVILRMLGLNEWADNIVIDGNLRFYDERNSKKVPVPIKIAKK